jgi:hypothetical protein
VLKENYKEKMGGCVWIRPKLTPVKNRKHSEKGQEKEKAVNTQNQDIDRIFKKKVKVQSDKVR